MNTLPIGRHCPKCQAPLADDAPQGLCPKCLLAAAATPTQAGQPPSERNVPPSLEAVAAAFPQLEILELIGQGGMGVVYKARQPRLERFVALKILPQSLACEPAFAQRFNREARVLARLNHPEIVTVYDFGEAGGFFFLLMEFVDGVNLRQAMQAGRFSPAQALHLVPRICEALEFAHQEGILHRDIKPENILLDTRGRVKIADFGIAKLLSDTREEMTLTASGMAIGTPHYMAPEQLEHPHDVDERADIYSLGVVFYEMLTGELPIGRFAPPSSKTPVDPRVDEVVFHALEKEREKRYRSAGEVKTCVEAISSSGAAHAAQAGPAVPEGLWLRRGPCYFSTPSRMRNCFPGPQAHILQCRGDLLLARDSLTFISPWQTRVVIPLREIRDLSMGQFQMYTTPWVMKYARFSFLSITREVAGVARTICLVPFDGHGALGGINRQTGEWFEAIRQAARAATGAEPPTSEPAKVTVGAQGCWNRKGIPLAFAPIAWMIGALNVRPVAEAAGLSMWLMPVLAIFVALTLGAMCWFSFGFLKANHDLNAGNLGAVTCDEPPGEGDAADTAYRARGQGPEGARRRPFWWTISAWAFIAIGLLAVVDTLAELYARSAHPTFYPGLAHLLAGIALLTLSRRWWFVALIGLGAALVSGAFVAIMMVCSPERGSVVFLPATGVRISVTQEPYLAAAAAVLLALVLFWPCYLLLSAKGRALFSQAKPSAAS